MQDVQQHRNDDENKESPIVALEPEDAYNNNRGPANFMNS
jgi:hypothetical protein